MPIPSPFWDQYKKAAGNVIFRNLYIDIDHIENKARSSERITFTLAGHGGSLPSFAYPTSCGFFCESRNYARN